MRPKNNKLKNFSDTHSSPFCSLLTLQGKIFITLCSLWCLKRSGVALAFVRRSGKINCKGQICAYKIKQFRMRREMPAMSTAPIKCHSHSSMKWTCYNEIIKRVCCEEIPCNACERASWRFRFNARRKLISEMKKREGERVRIANKRKLARRGLKWINFSGRSPSIFFFIAVVVSERKRETK